ncbi:MAG: hypothetical protein P8R54_25290 [Myxococcota bacterium]|nr:hypothetical protein [Myxococcota bacterium]
MITASAEQVQKIRTLITHKDPSLHPQGVALAKQLGDWSSVVAGCEISIKEGRWVFGDGLEIARISAPFDQGSVTVNSVQGKKLSLVGDMLTSAILELLFSAPGFDPARVTGLALLAGRHAAFTHHHHEESINPIDLGDAAVRFPPIEHLRFLTGFSALTSLDLQGQTALTNLDGLASCTALKTLKIGLGHGWGSKPSDRLRDLNDLAGLKSLQTLSLTVSTAISDLTPLAGCTALETLRVDNNTALTDIAPLRGHTRLTALGLARTSITSVEALAGCTSLKSLSLTGCEGLTNLNGLAGCTSLTRLHLKGCKNITDLSALKSIPGLNIERLEADLTT